MSFSHLKNAAYDNVARSQYRSMWQGLNAHDRHVKLINDYMKYYSHGHEDAVAAGAGQTPVRTDQDALREGYRFIRGEEDDTSDSWEVRLAKKYYSRLFKEYAIADLSRYKEGKIGLRWRTQQEVLVGKGQFTCGARGCDSKDGLCSYEVNFAYKEAGEHKQALVKLRVCPDCAAKLNYRREKQYRKATGAGAGSKAGRKRARAAAEDDEHGGGHRR